MAVKNPVQLFKNGDIRRDFAISFPFISVHCTLIEKRINILCKLGRVL